MSRDWNQWIQNPWLILGVFSLITGIAFWTGTRELPRKPVYKYVSFHADEHFELPTGAEFATEFEAPGPDITGLTSFHLITDGNGVTEVKIDNLTRGVHHLDKLI